jgi:dihydropteroate synthase
MADLASEKVLPEFNQSVQNLLKKVEGKSGVRRWYTWGERTYVMGIINVTPDSFSGDGLQTRSNPVKAAIEQAYHFAEAGADVLDIGGESTRPGSKPVSANEEMERVLPVVRALREELTATISIDTYKADVALAALKAGADWVNDVWGLRADHRMAEVVAQADVPVILMHNRSRPTDAELQARLGGRYVGVKYENLLEDIKRELLESVALAHQAGVRDEKIILDPGIGFGKTVEQNLELIDRLNEIRALGYPVLLGASRKGFIGYTLDLPIDERVEGTAAAATVGITRGADIIRVHDVKALVRVARMTDAIVRRNS